MFCRKCGMELKKGETICSRCGQVVKTAQMEKEIQQTYSQNQSQQTQQGHPQQVQQPQPQQGYPQPQSQQNQAGYPGRSYQSGQRYPQTQGASEYGEQGTGSWMKDWIINHHLEKEHAIAIAGCAALFLSLFMKLVSISMYGDIESATLRQYLEEVMERPMLVTLMGVCTIVAAVLFFCNKLEVGTLVGVASALPGFIALFSAVELASGKEDAVMHLGFGVYMLLAGTVLVLVPLIRKLNRESQH